MAKVNFGGFSFLKRFSAMRRLLPILRWGAVLCLGVLFLLAAAFLAARSGMFDIIIIDLFKSGVADAGVDLKMEDFTFDPAEFTFHADSVSAKGPDSTWLLETGKIAITVHPVASLSGDTTFSVVVENPRITGKIAGPPKTADGKPVADSAPPSWALYKLKITDGSVDLAFPDHDARLVLNKINVDWLEKRGKGTIGDGSLEWKGEREYLLDASFDGDRKVGETRIDPFYIRTTRLSATGGLRVGLLDRLGGEFNLRADLRDLPKRWLDGMRLAAFAPVGGMVEILGQFGGTLASPLLNCELQVSDGHFATIDVKSLTGSFDISEKGAKLRKGNLVSSVGTLRGLEGRVDFGEKLMLEAEAETEGYDLRRSMDLLSMDHFPVKLLASGKVSAKGQLYPVMNLDCTGENIRVTDFAVSTLEENVETVWYSLDSATVGFEARVRADKIDFGECFIDAGSVSAKIAKGRVDYLRGLEFDTVVKIKSLDSVQRYLPEGFDTTGVAEGWFGGDYDALKFKYSLKLDNARVYNRELGRVRASAVYDLKTLEVAELELDGQIARATAKGSAVLLPGGNYDLAVSLSRGDVANALDLIASIGKFEKPDYLRGEFSAEGELKGKIDAPELNGKANLNDLTIAPIGSFKGVRFDSVAATGVFGLSDWRADELEVELPDSKLIGAGKADLEKFSLSLKTEALPLGRLEEMAGSKADVAGIFSGVLSGEGQYRTPGFKASGVIRGLSAMKAPVGDVNAAANYHNGKVDLKITRLDGKASVAGSLDRDGLFQAEATLTNLPWTALPADRLPEGIKGKQLSGKGRITGLLGGVRGAEIRSGEWSGSVDEVYVADTLLGNTDVRAEYPSNTADTVRLEAGLWNGQARIYTLFSSNGSFSPRIGIDLLALDLSRLTAFTPLVLGGTMDMKATVEFDQLPPKTRDFKGIIREIRAFKAEGKAAEVRIKGAPPIAAVTFSAGGENADWWFKGDAPPFEKLTAKLSTTDFSWQAETIARDFDPTTYFPVLKDRVRARLGGKVAATGVGSSIRTVSGEGNIDGLEGYGIGPRAGRWSAVSNTGITAMSETVEIKVVLDGGISSKIVWRPADNDLKAWLEAKDAALEAWLPKDRVARGYKGTFSGSVEGSLSAQGVPEAVATLTAFTMDSPQGSLHNKGELVVSYRNDRVLFDSVELLFDEVEGRISGSLKPFVNYNLKIDALLDLGRIAKKIPRVEDASGKAHFQGTVSGDWVEPKISGTVEVRKGAEIKVEKLTYAFTNLTAQGEINLPGEIRIQAIDANFGEGAVHAEGRLTFKDFAPETVDLLLSAKDIAYEYPKGATYAFDGEFMLAGPFNQLELRGEARLKEFLYTRQIRWRTATLAVLERAKKARIGTKETGDIYIDVAVLGDRNLRIENNLANLEVESDLRVRGYLPTPQIWGRVDVNSGTVRFRAREYKLLRSNIEFLGDNRAVAVVDGRAVTSVGDYSINISASGPIEDIKIDLSSLPPLPRTDIVALLALGTTSEHLEKSEAVTAFEATNILTGSLQDELEGQAYDIFGIDQFQVNPSYSKQAQATVPRLTVGKSVASDVFARYAADLGSGQGQEVSLEYALKPGIVFLGSWNEEGTKESGSFGAELRFRYTFR